MRFSLHSPARNTEQITRRAEAAEALGFHALFFADGHLNNLDGFQAMTVCALRTERLRFGIAATTMAYRDPTTLALSAATSNEFSGGRAILGLGTGDGSTYRLGRKATRLAEFAAGLATIRELLGGRSIEVPRGKEGAGAVSLNVGRLPVPIYMASVGPRSLRVAGRYADGIMLGTGFDLDVLEWAQAHIAEGAREGGRELSDIDIAMAGMICVDPDGDRARGMVRARLANRAHHNFRFTTETVPPAELAGVRRFMAGFDISKPLEERADPALITDYMLRRFAIAGTPEDCRIRVRELAEAGVNHLLLTPPMRVLDEVMEMWGREVIPACADLE